MKWFVYALLAALTVLHHDFWLWDKAEPLVFGFLPPGMAYHVFYSIAVAGAWALAIRYAWPRDIEAFAARESDSPR